MGNFVKIAVIGGASSYTPELIEGILKRNALLKVKEVVLVDIPEAAAKLTIMKNLAERMIAKSSSDIKVAGSYGLREALKDCTYVITQFRQGGLKGRILDEKLPLKYNIIGQETTGPGGFSLALRTIPVILSIAEDMEKLCPDAWLINFTNPSGIIAEAVSKHSSIKCIGLCNVPINMKHDLSRLLGESPEDVYCEFVGLNHLSWIRKVYLYGRDVTDKLWKMDLSSGNIVANIDEMPEYADVLRQIKLIPSPYLNYYYFEDAMLSEEMESVKSGRGTRGEQVRKIEQELFNIYKNPTLNSKPEQLSQRGGSLYSEAALSLIESIHTNSGAIHVVNTPNKGAISDLDMDSVVETNCVITNTGAHPLALGRLPEVIRPLVISVKTYEKLTIEAAITGSREKAFQALMCHPLVHNGDKAARLLSDLLDAHKDYLGNFLGKES